MIVTFFQETAKKCPFFKWYIYFIDALVFETASNDEMFWF